MAPITSRQHALVKECRRIARGDDRFALIDGWHLLLEAVAAGVTIRTVAVVQATVTPALDQLVSSARESGAAVHDISSPVLNAISPVRTPSGVVAVIERRAAAVPQLLSPAPALVLMAVDMQDPGNVGAVIRSAEAGGATGVVFAGASSDAWSWKALRASMGSTFRLPVVTEEDALSILTQLKAAGVTVLATVPRGGRSAYETDMRGPTALVIGGEGPGLPDSLTTSSDALVTIPMQQTVESLNAAVAAALLVFEARRQREVTTR